jgi:hypothetical protein
MIASPLCGSSRGQSTARPCFSTSRSSGPDPAARRHRHHGQSRLAPKPTLWVAPSVPPAPALLSAIYSPDLNRSSSSSLSSNIGCAKPHSEPARPFTVLPPRASTPSHRPNAWLIPAARLFFRSAGHLAADATAQWGSCVGCNYLASKEANRSVAIELRRSSI